MCEFIFRTVCTSAKLNFSFSTASDAAINADTLRTASDTSSFNRSFVRYVFSEVASHPYISYFLSTVSLQKFICTTRLSDYETVLAKTATCPFRKIIFAEDTAAATWFSCCSALMSSRYHQQMQLGTLFLSSLTGCFPSRPYFSPGSRFGRNISTSGGVQKHVLSIKKVQNLIITSTGWLNFNGNLSNCNGVESLLKGFSANL